jgi:hypothetical protein
LLTVILLLPASATPAHAYSSSQSELAELQSQLEAAQGAHLPSTMQESNPAC